MITHRPLSWIHGFRNGLLCRLPVRENRREDLDTICRVSPIQCLCRICWRFGVQTSGDFSTPSSPLRRILGTLSSPGIVNPPHQRNKTVGHAPMVRFSQNTAYRVQHQGIDLLTHWPQSSEEPGDPIRFSACRVFDDLWFVPGIPGFREWPDNWYGFFPGNPGPASSVMLPRTSIPSTNRRKCSVEDGQGELYCDHHSSIY